MFSIRLSVLLAALTTLAGIAVCCSIFSGWKDKGPAGVEVTQEINSLIYGKSIERHLRAKQPTSSDDPDPNEDSLDHESVPVAPANGKESKSSKYKTSKSKKTKTSKLSKSGKSKYKGKVVHAQKQNAPTLPSSDSVGDTADAPNTTPTTEPDEEENGDDDKNILSTPGEFLTAEPIATPAPGSPSNAASTDDICVLSPSGSFGSWAGRGGIEVEFFYQVETISSITQQNVDDEMLPEIEKAVASRLLNLFFNDCRDDVTQRGESADQAVCEAQGYSSFPIDTVLPAVPCVGSREDPTNNCFVIDAGSRIYFESKSDCAHAANLTKLELNAAMDSGAFDEVLSGIVSIKYLKASDLDLDGPPTAGVESGSASSSDESVLPGFAWALIAVGVASTLVLGVFFGRRRRRTTDEQTSIPFEEMGEDGDFEQSLADSSKQGMTDLSKSTMEADKALPPMAQFNPAAVGGAPAEQGNDLLFDVSAEDNDVSAEDNYFFAPIAGTVCSKSDGEEAPLQEIQVSSCDNGDLPDMELSSGDDSEEDDEI